MAWLARLDARARRAPRPLRWAYWGLKWYLVALGTYGAVGLAIMELRERRAGLGLGLTLALVLAGIKGVAGAIGQARRSS